MTQVVGWVPVAILVLIILFWGCWGTFGDDFSTFSAHLPSRNRPLCLCDPGRGRRKRGDRGLPDGEHLRELAKTYLIEQRRHWPELARSGQFPEPTEETLSDYAAAFRQRFLGEATLSAPGEDFGAARVGVAYLRYSSENSNPRSLDQQLRNILNLAKRHELLIPWRFIFADSGVSGMTAGRIGYQRAKAALDSSPAPNALYFDDTSRLSRDMAETIQFCRELQERGQQVHGASDGFDTTSEMYKASLGISGLVSELYVDGLRQKVKRGQADGFRNGRNLSSPPFGYHLVPETGPNGQPLLGRKNKILRKVVIHPEHAEIVREVFRRYLEDGASTIELARWLNATRADGRTNWGVSTVSDMLDRYTYVGIEIRNKTYQLKDRETGKITHCKRPRSEWQCRRVRHLRIIDRATWKAVRKRRAERSSLFPEGSRGRVATYPKRLLRLVCGCCGAHLVLGKSGKYTEVKCPNALEGKQGCTHRGFKALKKIEGPILKLVGKCLVDPEVIAQIRERMAHWERTWANLPQADLVELEREVQSSKKQMERFVETIASDDELIETLAPRLKTAQRELQEARERLSQAKNSRPAPLDPPTDQEILAALKDLHGILDQNPAVAAPVLLELIGEVTVSQQEEEGCSKPVWYAEFRFRLPSLIRRVIPGFQAPDAQRWITIGEEDAERGELVRLRVDPPPKPPKEPKTPKIPPYVRLAPEAIRLRDEGLTFREIGERLGVHEVTAMRACDHARPEQAPIKGKKRPQGGSSFHLRRRLSELLDAGHDLEEAARLAGCSKMTARRVRNQLVRQVDEAEAA